MMKEKTLSEGIDALNHLKKALDEAYIEYDELRALYRGINELKDEIDRDKDSSRINKLIRHLTIVSKRTILPFKVQRKDRNDYALIGVSTNGLGYIYDSWGMKNLKELGVKEWYSNLDKQVFLNEEYTRIIAENIRKENIPKFLELVRLLRATYYADSLIENNISIDFAIDKQIVRLSFDGSSFSYDDANSDSSGTDYNRGILVSSYDEGKPYQDLNFREQNFVIKALSFKEAIVRFYTKVLQNHKDELQRLKPLASFVNHELGKIEALENL